MITIRIPEPGDKFMVYRGVTGAYTMHTVARLREYKGDMCRRLVISDEDGMLYVLRYESCFIGREVTG